MLFSSLTFLFTFLPLLLIIYFIIPKKFIKFRNIILLIFSLIFYAWGEPKYIILMFFTVLFSYVCGLFINYYNDKKNIKLIFFIIAILGIISSLLYFKYTNFFINNINNLFSTNLKLKEIILPIGISFYTFQILSYIIDLYRGKIKVQKNFFSLFLYISFFPQLIAGPIVKYETIEDQLLNRNESFAKFIAGLERFIIGLGKKIIIANNMAIIADAIFNYSSLKELSSIILLLGVLAYTFIGLGKMFGFEFLENFNYPYMAKSITDFWQRWHISLTTFFREYLYIPLGGNKVSLPRWILNMTIVWLLTGFWHGAAWTFILWGIYYLIILILEKKIFYKLTNKLPNFINYIITFILINIGWIIFRANNLSDMLIILKGIFTSKGIISFDMFVNNNSSIIPAIPYMILAIIFSFNIVPKLDKKFANNWFYQICKKIILLCIFLGCICFLVSSSYNPFIYFRF